jgi:VIT1/CCC1 family predicted Fe2+/Mn2+ transporter
VLGANDGIVSTASLIVGVASANALQESILLAGIAGLVAGAMSMAAGEYVSVSSQADAEKADLAIEQRSLEQNYDVERRELAEIYEDRGLDTELALLVAHKLMAHDALGAHARDDIGMSEQTSARPLQAAFFSAITFTLGAALPLLVAWVFPGSRLVPLVITSALLSLALLGGAAARAGGASVPVGAMRVTFWGSLAMALTALVGRLFDVVA